MRLVGSRLHVGWRRFRLSGQIEYHAQLRRPPWQVPVATFLCGVVGIPAALLVDSFVPIDLSWLVLVPAAGLFAAPVAILSMKDRWALIMREAHRDRCLYSSEDHQLILQLVATLREETRGPAMISVDGGRPRKRPWLYPSAPLPAPGHGAGATSEVPRGRAGGAERKLEQPPR